jgi:formate-dependent nitrite reductase membrane component NrfD
MDAVAFAVFIVFIASMYFAGQLAIRRGRSSKTWTGVASVIGPLAFPLLLLFPNLHGKNGDAA